VRDSTEPPGFMMGPKRCTMDTMEKEEAEMAAR
jgi:hypothetical protein